MKFTSEDLMKAMKLNVGDKVKIETGYIFEVVNNGGIYLERFGEGYYTDLEFLVDTDFDILPRPKRVGELKCGEYGKQNCNSCPIRAICVSDEYNDDTLYNKLELSHKYAKDQEIYDLLKARLDKEVIEE